MRFVWQRTAKAFWGAAREKVLVRVNDSASAWHTPKKAQDEDALQKWDEEGPCGQRLVVNPLNGLKLLWDLAVLAVHVFYLIYVPLLVATERTLRRSEGQVDLEALHYFFLALLAADLSVSLFTGYFEKGMLIMDRRQIRRHYLETQCWRDLLTIAVLLQGLLPLSDGESQAQSFPMLAVYLSLGKLAGTISRLQQRYQISNKNQNILQLTRLLLLVLFINHLFSCFWLYLGRQ